MTDLTALMIACAAFVGTHFLLSHPLRASIIGRIGERPFLGLYSLVALATFAAVVVTYRATAPAAFLWSVGDGIWGVASAWMWCASVLLAGSFRGNPALPDPAALTHANQPAQGVFAITRHPMMWSFILWAVSHIAVLPTAPNLILSGAILFLAFFGALGQDRRKIRAMGIDWQGWQGRTAFLPFGMQLTGKAAWSDAVPSPFVLAAGTLLWLCATWLHGAVGAGIWRWL